MDEIYSRLWNLIPKRPVPVPQSRWFLWYDFCDIYFCEIFHFYLLKNRVYLKNILVENDEILRLFCCFPDWNTKTTAACWPWDQARRCTRDRALFGKVTLVNGAEIVLGITTNKSSSVANTKVLVKKCWKVFALKIFRCMFRKSLRGHDINEEVLITFSELSVAFENTSSCLKWLLIGSVFIFWVV